MFKGLSLLFHSFSFSLLLFSSPFSSRSLSSFAYSHLPVVIEVLMNEWDFGWFCEVKQDSNWRRNGSCMTSAGSYVSPRFLLPSSLSSSFFLSKSTLCLFSAQPCPPTLPSPSPPSSPSPPQAPRISRLQDSFLLRRTVCSNKFMKGMLIILFLNEVDLVRRKLESGIRLRGM